MGADKPESTVALVKSSPDNVKTTPAGEYLTSALNEFDPEQYDSLAAISDGANKLLMLVCSVTGYYSVLTGVVWAFVVNPDEFRVIIV